MTLPRYEAICAHWEKTPPLSVSAWVIAQSLGAKKDGNKRVAADSRGQENDRQALFDMLGASGFSTKKPDWAK